MFDHSRPDSESKFVKIVSLETKVKMRHRIFKPDRTGVGVVPDEKLSLE